MDRQPIGISDLNFRGDMSRFDKSHKINAAMSAPASFTQRKLPLPTQVFKKGFSSIPQPRSKYPHTGYADRVRPMFHLLGEYTDKWHVHTLLRTADKVILGSPTGLVHFKNDYDMGKRVDPT